MAHDIVDPFDITGQDAAEDAQKSNEKNVRKALRALDEAFGQGIGTRQESLDIFRAGFAKVLADVDRVGDVNRQQARDTFTQETAGIGQAGRRSGLSSSTVTENRQRGAAKNLTSSLAGINEGLAGLRSDVRFRGLGMEANLLGGLAGAQEGRGLAESAFRSGVQYTAPPSVLQQAAPIIGAAVGASDVRLKTNIRLVGRSGRHNLYTWNWRLTGEVGAGVLADEVERYQPEAVTLMPNGFKGVFYGEL